MLILALNHRGRPGPAPPNPAPPLRARPRPATACSLPSYACRDHYRARHDDLAVLARPTRGGPQDGSGVSRAAEPPSRRLPPHSAMHMLREIWELGYGSADHKVCSSPLCGAGWPAPHRYHSPRPTWVLARPRPAPPRPARRTPAESLEGGAGPSRDAAASITPP